MAELRAAVESALNVLRELGVRTEDVRVRSLHDYYAVRIMLTESELVRAPPASPAKARRGLRRSFSGPGAGRRLFTSADYLAAQRERRRIIAEMQPLYERYDALITTGAGPAPHLDAHRSIGAAQEVVHAQHGHAVQPHRRARARAALRLQCQRDAARDADRRAAFRGCKGAADRLRLRAGSTLVRASSASAARHAQAVPIEPQAHAMPAIDITADDRGKWLRPYATQGSNWIRRARAVARSRAACDRDGTTPAARPRARRRARCSILARRLSRNTTLRRVGMMIRRTFVLAASVVAARFAAFRRPRRRKAIRTSRSSWW